MTELGLDNYEEILLRLQVKDFIRCKSVCKSWYSIISSDRFVKSQLKRHSNEVGDTRIIVSNGASIVNPSTREVKELRNLPEGYNVYVSGALVLVRSIDYSEQIRPHEHIRLSTYSECNYNFNEHAFIKSLVYPDGMGDGDGDRGDDNINDTPIISSRKRKIETSEEVKIEDIN
ncbi:F-box protein CPR1-like protein [Tanacetum coccineum]